MLLQLNRLQYVRNVNSNAAPSPFIYKRKKTKNNLGQRQGRKKVREIDSNDAKKPSWPNRTFSLSPPPNKKNTCSARL